MPPTKQARFRALQLRWLLLLPIPILWCVLSHYGKLGFVENKVLDWRFRYRGPMEAPVNVVYVDVDSLSIDQLGNFPWDRADFSRVAEALVSEGHVKAVGFDFVFSPAGMSELMDQKRLIDGNREFARFLHGGPPVVLAAAYGGYEFLDVLGKKKQRSLPIVAHEKRKLEEIEPPELPAFETLPPPKHRLWTPDHVGLIDTIDGGMQYVPAFAPTATRTYYHMSIELARLYFGLPPGSARVANDRLDLVRPDGTVVRSVPLRDRQIFEANWFSGWDVNTNHVHFSDALNYAELLKSEDAKERDAAKEFFGQLKDSVVMIGPVDTLLQDQALTPFDDQPAPRVGLYGNLLKTIVSGKYLVRLSAPVEYAIAFVLTMVVAVLALAGGSRAVAAKMGAVVVLALYAALAFYLFKLSHLVLPLTSPLGAALSTSFVGLLWQVLDEQKAKSRIKGMFGTYLAPTVVKQMVDSGKDPELGGHDAVITPYFSDIQKFSSFSEVLSSSQLGELLNEYLTACTDIVQAELGTLDKYIGDAVVAMFGAPVDAPDHAYRACVTSQLVQMRIAELREKWRSEGDKWPVLVHNLRTRIGLNTGQCMIGNFGSRSRFNYTMMGDNVNLAARMESGAKSWGAYTMCTEATKLACLERSDRVVFRSLSRLVVQGRSQAVPVHEIVGLKENLAQQTYDCIALFEQGLAKYYARDWAGAEAIFQKSAELELNQPGKSPGVSSNPSLVYLTKVLPEMRAVPPASDWDGRYVMQEK